MMLPKQQLEPIMTNSENIIEFGPNAYAKPATALNILRETVMGRELFDYAFKEYCRRWAFKHPRPTDFFRSMEDASAVDLDWFWRAWFLNNYRLDQAVYSVSNDLKEGPLVTIINLEQMAMPVTLSYETVSGNKGEIKLPLEIWNNRIDFDVRIPVQEKLKSVIIDPDKILPDVDFKNNTWNVQ
jgi:hypothetical protein